MPKKKRKTWKVDLKRRMKMKKLIMETQNHDRDKCNCEGCKVYALVGTICKNGRLYKVVKGWKDISPDEFHRTLLDMIKYKLDKKIESEKLLELLKEKGVPESTAKKLIEQMLGPLFSVFYKVPPIGILKEI